MNLSRYIVLVLLAVIAGCGGPPEQTAFMESQDNVAMSATELRIRLYDFADSFSGNVEMTADGIYASTDDPVIQRRTLQWKISATAEIYQAAFGTDPLGAYTDVWAFTKQMLYFLDTGSGQNLFGNQQPDAVATARILERRIHALGKMASESGDLSGLEENLEPWVRKHPLRDLRFTRESTTPFWAEYAASGGGGMAAVGRMEESIQDLIARLDIMSENLRKQARWETQLLMGEAVAGGEIGEFMARVDSLEVNIGRIRIVLEDLDPILSRQVAALMITGGELVMRERVLANEAWEVEREILFARMEAIQKETFALLAAERALILTEAEAAADRTIDTSLERTRALIDHLVWRIAQLAVAGLLIIGLLAIGAWRFRNRESRP
ncbi:MAG: hypothetical protein KAH56_00125 [Candidatus Krumholzibacteria bacterium]|nr:hypothetical protein [Candidatus Krumholzibacteria bacterium]